MSDTQIIEFLQDNSEFFTSNSMVTGILRAVGWMLVKLFTTAIDVCQTLYDATFGLVDITKWTGLETFLKDFKPLMEALLVASIVLLAFMIILGKQKQNHLLTSILIFAVVTTSSSYLFTQLNTWTIAFKDAVLSGNGQTNGTELVRTYLYDLIYIDKELGGLQNMKSDKNPPQYAALTEKEMDFIDLGETLPYDKKGLSKDAKKILKKKLDFRSGQCELEEVSNGVAWTDFGNDFYYRYHFRFGTYYLSAIALLLVLIGLSYKNTRIVYEVFVSRILVTLKSVDMSGSKKTVRVLECIRDGYYALCFTAITLKSYFMFTSYLNAQTGINAILKAVILLFIAWCVIDGADVMEKITGVDAGISGGLGKMLAAYHVARGGANMVRGGFNTAMQMKQYHMMKEQTKAMKQAAGNVSGAGNGASEYGMKEMDQMLSKDGEANEGQQKHTSENETDIRQEQNSSYESRGMEEQQTNMKSEQQEDVQSEQQTKEQTSLQEESHATETGQTDIQMAGMEEMEEMGSTGAELTEHTGQTDGNTETPPDPAGRDPEQMEPRTESMDRLNRDIPGNQPEKSRWEDGKNMFDRWEQKAHQADTGQQKTADISRGRPDKNVLHESRSNPAVMRSQMEERGKERSMGSRTVPERPSVGHSGSKEVQEGNWSEKDLHPKK